jgi:hypothetical protein
VTELILFHPLAVLVLSIAGLLLCGYVAISPTARSIIALAPLTPLFIVRLVGVGIVAGVDAIFIRLTAAQRHAARLQQRFNF